MINAGNRGAQRHATFAGIVLFGLLAMTARNAIDPDLWWHLRTGQWIMETGQIPHFDPFSFTRAGAPWVSHEWLSEIAFFELWKHLGCTALIIFSSIVTSAGFMLLYARCKSRPHWAAAATTLGALAAAPTWGVRPQMFTFTFTALLLWLVESGEQKPKFLLWIPVVFLLWLNLHAGFALAPALLIAYGVGLLCEVALGGTGWADVRPVILRVSLLLVAMVAIVPLNPSGAQLFRYPFTTLSSAGMRSYISEWFSPDFHRLIYTPTILLWLVLVVALAFSSRRPKMRVLLPLFLAGAASLDAARHIPIFVLLAVPVIATIPDRWQPLVPGRVEIRFERLRPLFDIGVVVLIAAFALSKWVILGRHQAIREAEIYPESAIQSLISAKSRGRIFAYYDWGGYVILKLYPDWRVFVDGRADLYGDDVMRQFERTVELHNDWKATLDYWRVDSVLLPPSCALTQALLIDSDWESVFSDARAVIFIRKRRA